MRYLALIVLLSGCRAHPVSGSGRGGAGGDADHGGSGGEAGSSGSGGSGGVAGSGGDAGGAGGSAGGSGGSGGVAQSECGSISPPCFALEQAFLLPSDPSDGGRPYNPTLFRPIEGGGFSFVGPVWQMPAGPGRLASVSLGADGSFIRARQLVDGYPPWAGTLTQDGFAAVLQGPPSPDGSDFGSARVLSRFGGGGEIAWTRSIDPTNPPGLGGNTDVLLALANGDLLAFLVIDVPSPAMPSTKETDSLARWSADGTPDGEASIGSWLLDAALLELADGRIILKVDNRSAGETESGGLDPGASAFEVLPSLQIRLLTRLSTGPIFNPPVALPGGGFAVVGVLSTGSSTDVAPGQPGHVAYDSTNQTSFVAVFESDGTLRWARRTRKAQTWTDIAGVLPDGGLVVRISGLNGEVEAGDGTFSSYSGTRALAVFGPTGDLRLLQAEPAPGENEGATQFDGGTLTLFAPGELLTSVVLGAGQPHETTLRNTADGASSYTMAVYRYIEH